MVNLEVLNPVAQISKRKDVSLASRLSDLSGKTIGLFWNTKPSGDILNQYTAQLLASRYNGIQFKVYYGSEGSTYRLASASDLDTMAKECDAVIGSLADWGGCTSWLVHDMIEVEKRGVPTISWVTPGFLEDAKMSARIFGAKGLGLALLSRGTVWEKPEQIQQLAAETIDQVINGLTKPVVPFEVEEEKVVPAKTLNIEGDDTLDAIEKMNRHFLSEGWGDGFPLLPPTPKAVEQMLSGTRLGWDEVLAVLEPGYGSATVEKVAINAVMAGCRPEHMPLLVTAVRCLGDSRMTLRRWIPSTGAQGPFTLVNGPITKKLSINSKCSALDPGSPSYANVVIGRAISLVILNIAHGYPGVSSMSTIGNPMNYSLCVAENEEDSPWEPYHAEKGFDKNTSTVSIMFVRGATTFADQHSKTAESIAQGEAWIASRAGNMVGVWLASSGGKEVAQRYGTRYIFLICPSHAQVLAQDGWDKKQLRQYLYEHAKLPFNMLMFGKEPSLVEKGHPQLFTCLEEGPEISLPIAEAPEYFEIAVVGGAGPCSSFFEGGGEFVTLPIEE